VVRVSTSPTTDRNERWGKDRPGSQGSTVKNGGKPERPTMCEMCRLRAAKVHFKSASDLHLCYECDDALSTVTRKLARVDLDGEGRERRILLQVEKLEIDKEARHLLAAKEAEGIVYTEIIRLDDFLNREIEAPKQIIEGVWNYGTPVLMAAQYKAGKTTLRDNAVKSLADGYDFLDRFPVNRLEEGTVVILDLELSEPMLQQWLRDQNIKNQDRVMVVPMRGRGASLNLMVPSVLNHWARSAT
jgi:AAA domain